MILIYVTCFLLLIVNQMSCTNDFNTTTEESKNIELLREEIGDSDSTNVDESSVAVMEVGDELFVDDLEPDYSDMQSATSVELELSENVTEKNDSDDEFDGTGLNGDDKVTHNFEYISNGFLENYETDLPDAVDQQTTTKEPTLLVQGLHLNGTLVDVSSSDELLSKVENRKYSTKLNRQKVVRKPGQTSLVIVFDGTGSMENCLKQLRTGAKMIIEKFANDDENPIYNYIFVPFRDPQIGPELVTTNQHELLAVLDELELWGGGDCPELALGGILGALTHALPKSFVYIFTDAIAKDFALDTEALSFIQKKQATLTFLLTGFCKSKDSEGYTVFERLATASNGQVYNLKEQDITDVLGDIKNTLNKRRVTLGYMDSAAGNTHSIDLPIDGNLKEFSISVAGHNPDISVFDPQNNNYTDAKEVLNLENLKVLNVQDPMPGDWNIVAGSDSAHSIRLTALSDVVFNFGFSLQQPERITETNISPLLGEMNILSITPSDNGLLHNLTSVRSILHYDTRTGNENTEFTLQLKKVVLNDGTVLYVTKSYQPPRQAFKIEVVGYDMNGNRMQRLLSTLIQSTVDKIPEVKIETNALEYNETDEVLLQCLAQSLTPMTLQWLRTGQVIKEFQANQTITFDLVISEAEISDAGLYTCRAFNSVGSAKSTVNLQIKPLKFVKIPEKEYFAIENETLQIPCDGAKKSFKVSWFFNNLKIPLPNDQFEQTDTNLLIKRTDRSRAGWYSCRVKGQSDETEIIVLYPPTIIDSEITSKIFVKYNDHLELHCNANGSPEPTINWYHDGSSNFEPLTDKTPHLRIESFQHYNEGLYKCVAINSIGSVQKHFQIIGLANAPPKIDQSPIKIRAVNEGDNVRFSCMCTHCKPLLDYSWEGPGILATSNHTTLNVSNIQLTAPYMESDENRIEYTLEIFNATQQNDGLYKCHLTNEFNQMLPTLDNLDSLEVYVEVLVQPKIEAITLANATLVNSMENTLFVGSSAYVKCVAYGHPQPEIHWTKDGDKVLDDTRIYSNNSTLTIENAVETDGGTYECIAINKLGSITKNFTLIIVAPPKLNGPTLQTHSGPEGEVIIIPCGIHGLPPPTISWYFNGNELTTSEKYASINNSLSFTAYGMDTGIYKCKASNEFGNATQEIMLLVNMAPTIYPQNDEVIEVNATENVVLNCDATGYPVPEISWKREAPSRNESAIDVVSEDGRVLLQNLTTQSDGIYICEASNGIGSAQKVFYIVVNTVPEIISEIPDIVHVKPGDEFSIACMATGNPGPITNWEFNGTNIGITLNVSSQTVPGYYNCQSSNKIGYTSRSMQIIISERPKQIDVANLEQRPNILQGEKTKLICPFINFDNIHWLKDNELLSSDNSIVISNDSLLFENATMEDTGNYSCIVENPMGQSTFSYELNVHAAPGIQLEHDGNDGTNQSSHVVTIHSGRLLESECIARGNPQPRIEWKHNGKSISSERVLRILHSNTSDSGFYSCIAKNYLGVATKNFTLQVLFAPIWSNKSFDQYLEVTDGLSLNLNCTMAANPLPIYTWFKDGMLTDTIANTYELPNININHNGTYVCKAENLLGANSLEYHVIVVGAAKIVSTSSNQTVIDATAELNLYCSASGVPTPVLSWTRNGQILSTSLSRKESLNNGSVELQLELQNITQHDKGLYNCVAINALGMDMRSVLVEVLVTPKFINEKSSSDVIKSVNTLSGLPILLICSSVYANPKPTLHWWKNESQLIENENLKLINGGKMLSILSSSAMDNGIYECVATNVIGESRQRFNVSIFVPPSFPSEITNGQDEFEPVSSKKLTVNEGDELQLNCPALGYPPPRITWLQLHYDLDKVIEEILPFKSSVIDIFDIKEPRTYSCFANSTFGEIKLLFHVSLNKPPTWLDNGDGGLTKVILYHGFTLSCAVQEGEPEPTIIWYKDGRSMNNLNDSNVFISTNGHYLRIIVANNQHSGQYECIASNAIGSLTRSFEIEVNAQVHWSPWTNWSGCSHICGPGQRKRSRKCLTASGQIANAPDARNCRGEMEQTENCLISLCPINGHWSDWSNWTDCSPNCTSSIDITFDSTRERYRRCDSPSPALGGRNCHGNDQERELCSVPYCPVDGEWSAWSAWSACSSVCGSGTTIRHRKCDSPHAQYGGAFCEGEHTEKRKCFLRPCSVDGGWSSWSTWSPCSKSCGRGQKSRSRQCDSPEPTNGGQMCEGNSFEVKICKTKLCPSERIVKKYQSKKLTPYAEVLTTPHESVEVFDDYDYEPNSKYEDSKYEYAERRSVEFVSKTIPQRVSIRVENYTPDLSDQSEIQLNHEGNSRITIDTEKQCDAGFELSNQECVDIDECQRDLHGCSHVCINSAGSYTCNCPFGFELNAPDQRNCIDTMVHYRRQPRENYVTTSIEKIAAITCLEGYSVENGNCSDIDECFQMSDECSAEETCLNTVGSYECMSTPCPHPYSRDESSGQCVQLCSKRRCDDAATVAKTISYTVLQLQLKQLHDDEPILKLVNYDINHVPLERTDFEYVEHFGAFKLKSLPNKNAISYLYVSRNAVQTRHIYKLKIIGRSMDAGGGTNGLSYITDFFIFVHII